MSKTNSFINKYIILMKNLSFTSPLSYNNYLNTDFGDINEDGKVTGLMEELTTGIGFTPIGTSSAPFTGNFDGQGYKISNIYENTSSNGGLFGIIGGNFGAEIKNISVSGNIVSIGGHSGGIVGCVQPIYAQATVKIENCINEVNTKTNWIAGGIVGFKNPQSGTIQIKNCSNLAKIEGGDRAGGILGYGYTNTHIKNCYNVGEIVMTDAMTDVESKGAGGIIGSGYNTQTIENCYNIGKVTSLKSYGGGIIGVFGWHTTIIKNCYNLGEITALKSGGIIGGGYAGIGRDLLIVKSCYYLDTIAGWGVGTLSSDEATATTKSFIKSNDMVNSLNNYIEENGDDTSDYCFWNYNENNYPTLNYKKIWNGSNWE